MEGRGQDTRMAQLDEGKRGKWHLDLDSVSLCKEEDQCKHEATGSWKKGPERYHASINYGW